MIKNLREILDGPYNSRKAVGSFNVYNYETIRAVVEAAKATQAPVILAFGEKYFKNMDPETLVAIVKSLDQEDLEICIHLDHCKDTDNIKRAIDAGFTSVMYDGSSLPFEENLKNTREVVDYAHGYNVSVEAELGSLGQGDHSHEGSVDDVEKYTDHISARDFVERTKVDALAVSIGTVHGLYKGEPNIRLDLLEKINENVDIPLVLHGGSGTPEDTIRQCIARGIAKINVNTEISMNVVEKSKEFLLEEEKPHFSELNLRQVKWAKDVVEKHIDLYRLK